MHFLGKKQKKESNQFDQHSSNFKGYWLNENICYRRFIK